MGQSPEANLVAPILLVVNTEAKEVSNRMVSFDNERPSYGSSAGDAGISASTLVESAHPWVLVT